MSLAVRVIPCLDVDDGRVVKGVHFENLRDAGDPVELAAEYYRQGADELTFLDVTASSSHRQTMVNVVTRTAEQIFIPLTVGGGVRTPEDVDSLLRCGADKVSVNTAAINDPTLISRVAERFGNQVLVLSVDARRERGEQHTQSGFEVTTMGGRKSTGIDALWWARRAEELGADALSIITPSFALASQKELYDHYTAVAKAVNLPIILYNIPARTGNKLLPETVQALCRDVENIVGAKDSSGDIENLKAYIRLTRELDKEVAILAGNDGAILTCLKEGGAGGIAGRANIWPETVAKIYDCFKAGDLEGAQAAQDAIAILQQTFKYGNPNTIIKTAVALQGHPVGKCRAPFNYVPEEGMEAIKKVLAENEAKGLH